MYFTREPLIETIMTPREGHKLSVRACRGEIEEYLVDALEVVSFGQALFFRSLEHPKGFLLPVNAYEVTEVREARVALKAAPLEKGVKIGGGKKEEEVEEEADKSKKDRRRRKRKSSKEESVVQEVVSEEAPLDEMSESYREDVPQQVEPFAALLPPPSALISQTMALYREGEELPQAISEPPPLFEE